MSELEKLIARVEAASEGSYALDAEIALQIAGFTYEKRKHDGKKYWREPNSQWRVYNNLPPRYTASLDAALKLVEAKLPRCNWRIQRQQDKCHAVINREHETKHFDIWVDEPGATPALALIAALLRALAQGGEP